mmetsp:Transcript_9095/g.18419  ORF Transcript_9095/g.18419 Transcript_9095/m.18419 type:complete len:81 (-) Transcript_9095:1584-1826(-)
MHSHLDEDVGLWTMRVWRRKLSSRLNFRSQKSQESSVVDEWTASMCRFKLVHRLNVLEHVGQVRLSLADASGTSLTVSTS